MLPAISKIRRQKTLHPPSRAAGFQPTNQHAPARRCPGELMPAGGLPAQWQISQIFAGHGENLQACSGGDGEEIAEDQGMGQATNPKNKPPRWSRKGSNAYGLAIRIGRRKGTPILGRV